MKLALLLLVMSVLILGCIDNDEVDTTTTTITVTTTRISILPVDLQRVISSDTFPEIRDIIESVTTTTSPYKELSVNFCPKGEVEVTRFNPPYTEGEVLVKIIKKVVKKDGNRYCKARGYMLQGREEDYIESILNIYYGAEENIIEVYSVNEYNEADEHLHTITYSLDWETIIDYEAVKGEYLNLI